MSDVRPPASDTVGSNGPVARWTAIERGGHFLEWEQPELVAKDLRAFFGSMR